MLPQVSMLVVMTGLSLLSGAALSDTVKSAETQPKKVPPAKAAQPDIKFLEYLGTLEGDDENWTEIAALALEQSEVARPEVPAKPEGSANAKQEAVAKPAAEKK